MVMLGRIAGYSRKARKFARLPPPRERADALRGKTEPSAVRRLASRLTAKAKNPKDFDRALTAARYAQGWRALCYPCQGKKKAHPSMRSFPGRGSWIRTNDGGVKVLCPDH